MSTKVTYTVGMVQFMKQHQVVILFVAICCLLLIYRQMIHRSDASQIRVASVMSEQEYATLDDRLTFIVERHNPREAFSLLRRTLKENSALASSCHALTHNMGHAAYRKYQDFGQAMEEGEAICNSGYMHGVIEEYFTNVDDMQEVIGSVCNSYLPGTFRRKQCDHGVGHGVMFATDNDLPASLASCDQLADAETRSGCVNGAFMENVMSDQAIHKSAFLKKDDPLYPCHDQKLQHKPHCYGYVTTNFLRTHPGDYSGALMLCDKVEKEYISSCLEGAGRRMIVELIDRPDDVYKLCMTRETGYDTCLRGMIYEYVNHFGAITQATDLCQKFPSDERNICINAVKEKALLF